MGRSTQRLAVHRFSVAGKMNHSGGKTTPFWLRAAGISSALASRLRFWLTVGPGLAVVVLSYVPLLGLAVLSFSDQPMSGVPYPLTLSWYHHLTIDTRWAVPVE